MLQSRRGIRTALIAATCLVPVAASGQSGILHKRGPSLPKSISAPRLSASPTVMGGPVTQSLARPGEAATATATATVTVTGLAVQECIGLPVPGSVAGIADGIDAMPVEGVCPGMTGDIRTLPMPMPMPLPIEGDGLVHILPVGPPEFFDFADSMPHASHDGLARATMAAEKMPTARGPASLPQASAGAGGLPQRALGVRPGSIAKPAALTRASAARADAVPAHVQNVGDLPTTTAPRWRDRIRFAWPGSGE